MLCAAWPHMRGDLASTRQAAAVFLDDLDDASGRLDRRKSVARWTNLGQAHCLVADLKIETGAFEHGCEAWLCALTAFEVARRLVDDRDSQSCRETSARIAADVRKFGLLEERVNRIAIPCGDQSIEAYYVPADRAFSVPAVICVSGEDETGDTLLARLLPAVKGRGISILVLSYDTFSGPWRSQSAGIFSCCIDYLSAQADVDATRIGVYGEGLSAALATDFAAWDDRVAAAVCDGGLWNWARKMASIGWITGSSDVADNDASLSASRLRSMRQLKCPALLVAGSRGTVHPSEAAKLQAECAEADIHLDVEIPAVARTPLGEIENFVKVDDFIFGWLERKLANGSAT